MTIGSAESRFPVNEQIANTPCAFCAKPFVLGETLVVCKTCNAQHHDSCWDTQGGCATTDCENAPLPQLNIPKAAKPPENLPKGNKQCPFCKEFIQDFEEVCPFCDEIVTPDGVFHGPKENAPGAVSSLVYALIGIFVCQIILGIVAIVKANSARALIKSNPRYGGEGLATAGLVIGIIDLVLFVFALIINFARI